MALSLLPFCPEQSRWAAFLPFSSTAWAASGDTFNDPNTESGSTLELTEFRTESEDLTKDRAKRADNLRTKLLQGKKNDTEFHTRQAAYRKKSAEYRRDCREDLRRANRDTKFTVLVRCYHGELTLEKDFLLQQRTYLENLTAVSSAEKRNATDRLNLLIDAIDTIVFALDSGVYGDEAELIEARKNLAERYRKPFHAAMALVRADRSLSIIASLIIHLDAAKTEEGENPQPAWNNARRCLTTHETSLRTLLELRSPTATQETAQILAQLHSCMETLQAINEQP